MMSNIAGEIDVASGSIYYGTRRILASSNNWHPSGSAKKHLTAEFLGSVLLHFIGAACVVNSLDLTLVGKSGENGAPQSGILIAALGNGFVTAALMYVFGGENGSGGKLNPAVSTGLYVAQRIQHVTFVSELAMQFFGAALGGLLVRATLPESLLVAGDNAGDAATFRVQGLLTGESVLRTFVWEILCTALVVFVYFATAVDRHNLVYTRNFFPLAVGLSVAAGELACGPFVGISMNPARAVAAAVAYWDVTQLWIYVAAGVMGGILGSLLHLRLFLGDSLAPMLSSGSVFEGVRMERRELQDSNFIMYVVIDEVRRDSQEPRLFNWGGRVVYPEMSSSTCAVRGVLSLDGRLLSWTESGGHFDEAVSHGCMPDTGHIAGIQSHSNGLPLANFRLSLLGRRAASRIIASLGPQAPTVVPDEVGFYGDVEEPDVPPPPPNTTRAHHSLV